MLTHGGSVSARNRDGYEAVKPKVWYSNFEVNRLPNGALKTPSIAAIPGMNGKVQSGGWSRCRLYTATMTISAIALPVTTAAVMPMPALPVRAAT